MVNKVFSLLIFLATLASATAYAIDDSYEDGKNYWSPRPYKTAKIVSLAIENNGERSDIGYAPNLDCSRFNLAERDIKEYFQRARVVSRGDFMHQFDWSPCYARGTIVFSNGDKGVWVIQGFRLGSLDLIDGRKIYFNCVKCRAKAFTNNR